MPNSRQKPHWKSALVKGLKGRCPNCGETKLFRAFLKPVDRCASCGEAWSEVRADDGPAWATMLIVGHLLVPVFHILFFSSNLPSWASTLILVSAGVAFSLTLLPRIKGGFMGLIWATGAPTS
jgi:uncharacterized protein (DUF983 family)